MCGSDGLILVPVQVHDILVLVCLAFGSFLPLYLTFLITHEDSILKTVKEVIGFATIFGGIYWYTMDPMLKKAIKLAVSSSDIKITEKGLEYKPFVDVPVTVVISGRSGRPTFGFAIRVG